ncbi:putative EMP1-like protein, partial [Plasmodium gaboni]
LKAIFKRIHEQNGIKEKYSTDTDTSTPPFKTLREHWWSANRDQIWKAMTKCSGNICSDGTTPLDDYVPQTLRWQTEWSHQFCVERKTLADDVVQKCDECKKASDTYHSKNTIDKSGTGGSTTYSGTDGKDCNKTNGGNNSSDPECGECNKACKECKTACTAYTQFVSGQSGTTNDWRQQWQQMENKYRDLMEEAKTKLEQHHKDQQKQPKSSSTENIPPYMTPCGNNS